ncbi:MAG: DUF6850 family outer membrane beta-barrel protein [Rikenellaceae bacterium]
MNRSGCYISTLFFLMACALQLSNAQANEGYERVMRRDLWGEGSNVTSILRDSVTTSYAEIRYGGESGGFRDFSDAESEWSVGAKARTVVHHKSVAMVGAFDYEHWEGANMCGSMFISPNSYPFDLLEFTPGDKRLQSYYLMGGITTAISDRFAIGVVGDFKSQNYAKFKDLRHYNYRMELGVKPSLSYRIGSEERGATIGATAIFMRNSESVRADVVGSANSTYYAFLDKGLMLGAYENWDGSGVHLNESGISGFPVRENLYGGAIQGEWGGLFAEVEYIIGSGEVGEKLTYWFDFPSQRYGVKLGYNLKRLKGGKERLHLFRGDVYMRSLVNNEFVLNNVTEGGVTTTVTLGSNKIFEQKELCFAPSYEYMVVGGGDFNIGVNYSNIKSRSTLVYPYINDLNTSVLQLYSGGSVNIGGGFQILCRALFSIGSFSEDSYKSDSNAGSEPFRLTEYYNVENEYLTATYISGWLGVRYNASKSWYCEIGGGYTHAFDLSYVYGNSRYKWSASAGYRF